MFLLYWNPVLIAAAVIPAVVLLVKIYRADRLEPEPPGLLLSLVLLGVISTGLAMVTEEVGSRMLAGVFAPDSLPYRVILYFGIVACSEEGFKYLLLKKRTWSSPSFDCQFDGIVYAVFVSLGFALWENIGYVVQYGFGTALIRAVTAVPGHACFGVFMGAWYGNARKYENCGYPHRAGLFRVLSFLFPVVLHGGYDFAATEEADHYAWIFVVFIAVLFAAALLVIRRMSKNDRYIDPPVEW